MSFLNFFRRRGDMAVPPPGEDAVLRAADEFLRKQRLVVRLTFLDDQVRRAATDAALNRFLDVLFSHLRS